MRGQIEISFQWIMVAIAGAAFLLIFFFTFKACTQIGGSRIEGTTLKAAAATLSATAWQVEITRNVTLDASASCVGGTITLQSGNSVQPLDQTPAFLPPTMHDPQLVTHQIGLSVQGVPPVILGSALYALDDNTDYYVVKQGNYQPLLALLGSSVKLVDANKVSEISGKNVVIASYAQLRDVPNAKAAHEILIGDKITFYELKNGAWSQIGQPASYAGDVLAAGAVASADPALFTCAKANVIKRMGYILQQDVARNNLLMGSVNDNCRTLLKQVNDAGILNVPPNAPEQRYLDVLKSRAMIYQQALYSAGCPVI